MSWHSRRECANPEFQKEVTRVGLHQAARRSHRHPSGRGRAGHRVGSRDPGHRQGEAPGGRGRGRRAPVASTTTATASRSTSPSATRSSTRSTAAPRSSSAARTSSSSPPATCSRSSSARSTTRASDILPKGPVALPSGPFARSGAPEPRSTLNPVPNRDSPSACGTRGPDSASRSPPTGSGASCPPTSSCSPRPARSRSSRFRILHVAGRSARSCSRDPGLAARSGTWRGSRACSASWRSRACSSTSTGRSSSSRPSPARSSRGRSATSSTRSSRCCSGVIVPARAAAPGAVGRRRHLGRRVVVIAIGYGVVPVDRPHPRVLVRALRLHQEAASARRSTRSAASPSRRRCSSRSRSCSSIVVGATVGLAFGHERGRRMRSCHGRHRRRSPATPLLLFAAAARRLPLVGIGLTQFLAPVLQFLFGRLHPARGDAARALDRVRAWSGSR